MSVVFITGAAGNTGFQIARKFASEGFEVAISSRTEDSAKAAAEKIANEFGVRTKGYAFELSNVPQIIKTFEKIKKDFGRLDTFVANAAQLGLNCDMLTVTEEDYSLVLDANLKGNYFCCQQAIKIMKEQEKGSIVIISSVHSKECAVDRSLYTASKGGLNALARSIAIEFGAYSIRANVIIAGAIRTDRFDRLTDEEVAAKRKNWPIGLESTGEDIANGAFYLGTDLSKTVTGTELTIDSGILTSLLPFNGGKR